MLQIRVGDARRSQPRGQLHPQVEQQIEHFGWPSDWATKRLRLCPSIHRIFTSGYQAPPIRTPSVEVAEVDHERQLRR